MIFTYRNAAIGFAVFLFLFLLLRPNELQDLSPLQYARGLGKESPAIWNSTLGFQKVFVINIPERTDRRDAITVAAALSEIDITWIDGVMGGDVSDKVLPADSWDKSISRGNKGSWRAHMNALQIIIHENLTSAMIIEDDADWDIRIKSQLQVFAQAARAFTQPTSRSRQQRPQSLAEMYNPTNPNPNTIVELPLTRFPTHSFHPTLTPYGDDWDVLWLGHCGTDFPQAPPSLDTDMKDTKENTDNKKDTPPKKPTLHPPPLLRVPILNDLTVPSPQNLKPHPFALTDPLAEEYPPHTRVVHASSGTICTQAYAVSQQGARKLLWQFGMESLTAGWDLMLRDWCDGSGGYFDGFGYEAKEGGDKGGARPPVCVTVQPPLFSHHYGKGSASDIMAPGGGFVNKGREMTPYLRYSVRLNMGRLVNGASGRDGVDGLVDQFPDA